MSPTKKLLFFPRKQFSRRLKKEDNPRGIPRSGSSWLNRKKTRVPKVKKGPTDSSIADLQEHYFDFSGYNEADRYMDIKKSLFDT